MVVYKANKYYTTMNFDTFLILGADTETMEKAHELQLKVIENNCDDNCTKLNEFVKDNNLIYLDDVSSPMETCKIQGTNYLCSSKDEIGYIYEIVNDFTSRF